MKVRTINTGLNDAFILVVVGFSEPDDAAPKDSFRGEIEVRLDRTDGLLSEIKAEAIAKAKKQLEKTVLT